MKLLPDIMQERGAFMRVISMMMGDLEVARIEEGKFRQLVKSSPLVPSFADLYNDCFYGINANLYVNHFI